MTTYKRISARSADDETEIEIETLQWEIKIKVKGEEETEQEIKLLAEDEAGQPIPDLFFHINRDYSVAVATGSPPPVWPEDEPEEPILG